MRFTYVIPVLFVALLILGCHEAPLPANTSIPTKEQQLQQNLNTLKNTARSGDLLVRLSDDIVSQQVTGMNERERLYSHGGLIAQTGGKLYVYHITPDLPGADTIRIEPIDSFINPDKNIRCALFRYQLSAVEKDSAIRVIETDKAKDIRFDMVYDLASNDKMYCSEMISKALTKATNSKMVFRTINAPERMKKLLLIFFKKQHLTKEVIDNRKFISLDNLYLRPDCKELMHFDLKIFPGQ